MNNIKAVVYVTLKDHEMDPQGETLQKELKSDSEGVDGQIDEVCTKLLANPVIEKFEVKKAK